MASSAEHDAPSQRIPTPRKSEKRLSEVTNVSKVKDLDLNLSLIISETYVSNLYAIWEKPQFPKECTEIWREGNT